MFATQSSSQMKCETAAGVGPNLYWTLSIGSQASNTSAGPTSYGKPVISLFSGDGAANASTSGNQVCWCCPYGVVRHPPRVTLGIGCCRGCRCCACCQGWVDRALCARRVQSVVVYGLNFGPLGTPVVANYSTHKLLSSIAVAADGGTLILPHTAAQNYAVVAFPDVEAAIGLCVDVQSPWGLCRVWRVWFRCVGVCRCSRLKR